ncbi:hypothetical protein MMC25_003860 [Agyrium rufum]|nr:hypothetical protein [Agyrium rufum]
MQNPDLDHQNYYSLQHRRQSSKATASRQSTDQSSYRASIDAPLTILPASTYRPTPKPSRSVPAPNFEQYVSDASVNGFTQEPPSIDDSSDPHEFYKDYRDQIRKESAEGYDQPDIFVADKGDNRMPTASQAQSYRTGSGSAHRSNGVTTASSRSNTPRSNPRLSTSPVATEKPLNVTKSSPQLTGITRQRQSSLQDLVNKFNQNPDQVPPLPVKSGSRPPSITRNSFTNQPAKLTRTRTPSLTSVPGSAPLTRSWLSQQGGPEQPTTLSQRKKYSRENVGGGPKTSMPMLQGSQPKKREGSLTKHTFGTQSAIDLISSTQPSSARAPLFGELLGVNRGGIGSGFGIPGARPRRGSEGSMHSPNPMFVDDRRPSNISSVSSTSPSFWYMEGATPSLDGIDFEKPIPSRPPGLHRRSHSDFTTLAQASSRRTSIQDSDTLPLALESPASTRSTMSKATPTSRLPISSRRRMSAASDSSSSSPSFYSNFNSTKLSTPANKRVRSPTKTATHISNITNGNKSAASVKSPKRAVGSPRKEAPNPLLKAYISTPPPAKSPPLRSSRPRQPVSMATTSASRARAIDRSTASTPSKMRDTRPKHIPELGNVDFAARRQRIQQAYTQKLQEQERHAELEAERKRISHARASQYLGDTSFTMPQLEDLRNLPTGSNPLAALGFQKIGEDESDAYATPGEETTDVEKELRVNTKSLIDRSVLDLSQEDSPTLGMHLLHQSDDGQGTSLTPPSDKEPESAVTTASVDTFFDNEPQEEEELPNHRSNHLTVLNHAMRLRDPSPASPPSSRYSVKRDSNASDRDDIESIEIMLGETPITEHTNMTLFDQRGRSQAHVNEPGVRWSLNSWTSSIRSGDEQEDEHEVDQTAQRMNSMAPPRREDTSNHVSLSTIASSYTQPWSPDPTPSLFSTRTTMDSNSYDTLNKVLDQYHDPSMPPEVINDLQQHMVSQSPNFARAGGWDPKKVTQLYLEEIRRNNGARQSSNATQTSTLSNEPVAEVSEEEEKHHTEVASRNHENTHPPKVVIDGKEQDQDYKEEKLGHRKTNSNATLSVPFEFNRQRASLTQPDDWANTSPSFFDWIRDHSTEETPTDARPPPPIRKDSHIRPSEIPRSSGENDCNYYDQAASEDKHQLLPEIPSGDLGIIGINVVSPHDGTSTAIPSSLPISSSAYSTPPRRPSIDRSLTAPELEKLTTTPPRTLSNPRTLSLESETDEKALEALDTPKLGKSEPLPAPAKPPVKNTSTRQGRPSAESARTTDAVPKGIDLTEKKRLGRRFNIIKELIDTEHSFGQDMRVIDDIYKGTSVDLDISPEDIRTLFGNSDQISAFSAQFLDVLKQAARSVYRLPKSRRFKSKRESQATANSIPSDDATSFKEDDPLIDGRDRQTFIGEAFVKNMTQMEKVYADYLKNHEAANMKLQSLQKNEKVQVWLKECRNFAHDLTSAWDLDSLLVKPVQRILKYPLLLNEIVNVTPENHPDFTAIITAAQEMIGVSKRINEMKKRADIVEQVAGGGRKRKDSDGRIGLSGKWSRKVKENIGILDSVQDSEYSKVAEKYGQHFFQLQVAMKDVEGYTRDIAIAVHRYTEFGVALEGLVDVGSSTNPTIESKWRKFRMSMREMEMTALTDHVNVVRKNVVEPMRTLLTLHESPQKLMNKRSKRQADFSRLRSMRERGERPDKKTIEQAEQFKALNDTLKDELPRLFGLTGKLVIACLNNFVQLQLQWQAIWRRKLCQAIDVQEAPKTWDEVVTAFRGDFEITEAQALSLGICNGSIIADAANFLTTFLSPTTTLNGDDNSSPRQSASLTLGDRSRALSIGSTNSQSPGLSSSRPDYHGRNSDQLGISFLGGAVLQTLASSPAIPNGPRVRASSSASNRSPVTPEVPGAWRNNSGSSSNHNSGGNRPSTGGRTSDSPSMPRLSVDTPDHSRLSGDSYTGFRTTASSSQYNNSAAIHRSNSSSRVRQDDHHHHSQRYSGFFNSALPMDSSNHSSSERQSGSLFGQQAQGQQQQQQQQHGQYLGDVVSSPPTINTSFTAAGAGTGTGGGGGGGNGGSTHPEPKVLWVAVSVYEFSIDQSRGEAGYPYLTYVAGEVFDVIAEKGELWLAYNQDDAEHRPGWLWARHFAKLAD